ncbi:MAG: DUF3418 domain-containing protein, partial [Acidimicrobiales bacterium]
ARDRAARDRAARDRAARDAVHRSLLAGLLSHVGLWDQEKRNYQGARNARFAVWPGSALAGSQPRWIMAAELVETSRLWARVVARVQPEWIEALAGQLVKRSYSEPRWVERRGEAVADERVTLYGVPVVASRRVGYGRVDRAAARELFIRHALLGGEWETGHAFWHDNVRLVEEVRAVEVRARRWDILVEEEVLFDFYDQAVGKDVVSTRHFDTWWRKASRTQPRLLHFPVELLLDPGAGSVDLAGYPGTWRQGDLTLPVSYELDPGSITDGLVVEVPLGVLNQVSGEGFDWQVPGLREELVTALVRSLPKAYRRPLVPIPERVREFLAGHGPGDGPLLAVLARALSQPGEAAIPPGAWQIDKVPPRLLVTFRVTDEAGATVAAGKDLDALRSTLAGPVRDVLARAAVSPLGRPGTAAGRESRGSPDQDPPPGPGPGGRAPGELVWARLDRYSGSNRAQTSGETTGQVRQEPGPVPAGSRTDRTPGQAPTLGQARTPTSRAERSRGTGPEPARRGIEQTGITEWDFGTLPAVVEGQVAGRTVRAYPALVDESGSVAIRVLASEQEQRAAMWAGTRRLLIQSVPSPLGRLRRALTNATKLALAHAPHAGPAELMEDCLTAAADQLLAVHGGPVRDPASWDRLRRAVAGELPAALTGVVETVADVLGAARAVERRLEATTAPALAPTVEDVWVQLYRLVYPGFVAATGAARLAELPRYLAAMERRLDKAPEAPRRDQERMARIRALEERWHGLVDALPPGPVPADLAEVRWMTEELRVAVFAQVLGTRRPASETRVARALDEVSALVG